MGNKTVATVGYKFDNEFYGDTEAGKQELLEAINTAIETEAWSDPELKDASDDERQEAVSMSYDGTNRGMEFWDNCMAIMQQCPYSLDIVRIDDETTSAEDIAACKAWLYLD